MFRLQTCAVAYANVFNDVHEIGEKKRRTMKCSSTSSSSVDYKFSRSETPAGKTRRRNSIADKKKCDRSSVLPKETPAIANAPDNLQASPAASCRNCNPDSSERNVEVCQICYGLKRKNKTVEEEYCSYPFSFIKKKHLPMWLHEPEYMMVPKPKVVRQKSDDNSQEQQHTPKNSTDSKVHKNQDSLFSTSSGFTNYRGLLNLALILLVLSNTRLFIENLMKYGLLIQPVETFSRCFDNLDKWPNVKILLVSSVHPLVALLLELGLSKGRIPEAVGVAGHFVNGLVQLVYPAAIVLLEHPSPVFSALTLATVTCLFLKLISYAHTNYWCRLDSNDRNSDSKRRRRQSTSADGHENESEANGSPDQHTPVVQYPDNINLKDMMYFVVAPTLCYELNFPRSARIRKRFLIKRVVEMVFLLMVIIGLVQQWIVPTINNAIKPLSDLNFFKSLERLLKLSIPNHLIWLMFFYTFFHSMLNVLAELLMFGDRDFYQDWWNADTINEFWNTWNIPVHRWATRHIYKPIRRRGISRLPASVIVFLVSAFFHEYLVSIPLRMFKVWAFSGMVMQVPMALVTGKWVTGKWGNICVWLSLILGQPVAILAYVHDYYVINVVTNLANGTAPGL